MGPRSGYRAGGLSIRPALRRQNRWTSPSSLLFSRRTAGPVLSARSSTTASAGFPSGSFFGHRTGGPAHPACFSAVELPGPSIRLALRRQNRGGFPSSSFFGHRTGRLPHPTSLFSRKTAGPVHWPALRPQNRGAFPSSLLFSRRTGGPVLSARSSAAEPGAFPSSPFFGPSAGGPAHPAPLSGCEAAGFSSGKRGANARLTGAASAAGQFQLAKLYHKCVCKRMNFLYNKARRK